MAKGIESNNSFNMSESLAQGSAFLGEVMDDLKHSSRTWGRVVSGKGTAAEDTAAGAEVLLIGGLLVGAGKLTEDLAKGGEGADLAATKIGTGGIKSAPFGIEPIGRPALAPMTDHDYLASMRIRQSLQGGVYGDPGGEMARARAAIALRDHR